MLAADIIFGGLQLSRKMRLLFGLTAKKIGSTASDGGLRAGLAAREHSAQHGLDVGRGRQAP